MIDIMFGEVVQAENMLMAKIVLGFHDILSTALITTGFGKSATDFGGVDCRLTKRVRAVMLMDQVADPVPPHWKKVAEMPVKLKPACIPGPV